MNGGECYKYYLSKNSSKYKEYCICDENYSGEFCEFKSCDFEESDYLFGTKDSVIQLNLICPPKIITSCSDCQFQGF